MPGPCPRVWSREGWPYGLAVYHCLITALTVGYGDVSIETVSGRVCASVCTSRTLPHSSATTPLKTLR